MTKGKLGVLEGLSLIKDDGTRPHYLTDTQGVLDDAKTSPDVDDEPDVAALEDVGRTIDLQSKLQELEAYIAQREPLHAEARAELIKLTGDMVTIRGNLRYRDELLRNGRKLLEDLYAQQAMTDEAVESRLISFMATLDGLGIK